MPFARDRHGLGFIAHPRSAVRGARKASTGRCVNSALGSDDRPAVLQAATHDFLRDQVSLVQASGMFSTWLAMLAGSTSQQKKEMLAAAGVPRRVAIST